MNNNLINEIKNIAGEYANVFVQKVSSVEELENKKLEFDKENLKNSWCITACSYMCSNILVTEYYDSDDLYDGHVVCVYHIDANEEDIVTFCNNNL